MFCIATEIAGFVLHFDPQLSNPVYADLDQIVKSLLRHHQPYQEHIKPQSFIYPDPIPQVSGFGP
jgi:hypothetical protein